eukprot:m.172885 g.172885  ORF g.172885 m.172885 type:complete len:55 (+) comp24299_c0_seq3:776-940(+)
MWVWTVWCSTCMAVTAVQKKKASENTPTEEAFHHRMFLRIISRPLRVNAGCSAL